MSRLFEELAHQDTPWGTITLRRRFEPSRRIDVFEVKLDDEFLMSSLFTVAEIELARLGLAACRGGDLRVAVGGLGLGYTARAALEDERVATLRVIEALGEVVSWHERDLLPDTVGLASDPRVELVTADFFAGVAAGAFGTADGAPDRSATASADAEGAYDAILLDIDHSPRHVLHERHAAFYTVTGLRRLAAMLDGDGVFALWSDDPPDDDFLGVAGEVFEQVVAHEVTFPNFYLGSVSSNTVYVARGHDGPATTS
jgi:spermidine synthase